MVRPLRQSKAASPSFLQIGEQRSPTWSERTSFTSLTGWFDPTWTSELEDGPPATTYVEWVDCLVRPKRWIDEPMLAVGATLMQRSIVVFVWSASSWPKGWVIDTLPSLKKTHKEVSTKPPLPILLKDKHYVTLLKNTSPWPLEWNDLPVHRKTHLRATWRGEQQDVEPCKLDAPHTEKLQLETQQLEFCSFEAKPRLGSAAATSVNVTHKSSTPLVPGS